MSNDDDADDTSKICPESSTFPEVAQDDFTADALRALTALGALGEDQIPFMVQLGGAVAKARAQLPHGSFTPWCKGTLDREPTWCAAHRRLFEKREDIEPARAWAKRTGHRWANCVSVERLLKLVAESKKGERSDIPTGDIPTAPKARRKLADVEAGLAQARERIAQDDADFVALRDELSPEDDARARELAPLAAVNNVVAKKEFAALALRHHWRYGDLIERETDGAPQVSEPTLEGSAHPRPGAAETDARMDEAGHPRDQGNTGDSSGVGAAPTTDLDNPQTVEVLDEASPGGGDDVHEIRPENSLANNLRPSGTRGSGIVFPNTVMRNSVRVPVVPQIGARE